MDDSYTLSMPRLRAPSLTKAAPYIMKDDERYPIPVEDDPGLHPYTPPLFHEIVLPSTVSPISISLTTVTRSGYTIQKAELGIPSKTRSPRRKCCSVRWRIFTTIVAGMALLIIIGIVVGIVVTLKLKAASETTRLPALTSSGLFIGTNDTEWNPQIAYTNTTSGKVTFRLNSGVSNFTAPQTMNLTIVLDANDPISTASMLGTDGNIYINLFYIHNSRIVLANVSCAPNSCTTVFNGVISDELSFPVYESSVLAALYLGAVNGTNLSFRVYYHNTDRYLTQLSMGAQGLWDHGTTFSGKAVSGSSISAARVGTTGALMYSTWTTRAAIFLISITI